MRAVERRGEVVYLRFREWETLGPVPGRYGVAGGSEALKGEGARLEASAQGGDRANQIVGLCKLNLSCHFIDQRTGREETRSGSQPHCVKSGSHSGKGSPPTPFISSPPPLHVTSCFPQRITHDRSGCLSRLQVSLLRSPCLPTRPKPESCAIVEKGKW